MPTKREREYYRMGFEDGLGVGRRDEVGGPRIARAREVLLPRTPRYPAGVQPFLEDPVTKGFTKKRKLSAWNKYVKANSKKPRFRYRNGKLNLKKMAIAFRKTPAGKKKRR